MPIHELTVTLKEIPPGNRGILVSARHLVDIVKQFRRSPEIRFLAEDIVQSCPNKDYSCEVSKIYNWVKDNIRFTRDPNRVEMLRSPLITLNRRNGDCDDHTILISSLLQSIGYPTRAVIVATQPQYKDAFNHIFTEVGVQNKGQFEWIPLDTTVSFADVGWLPPGFLYKRFLIDE